MGTPPTVTTTFNAVVPAGQTVVFSDPISSLILQLQQKQKELNDAVEEAKVLRAQVKVKDDEIEKLIKIISEKDKEIDALRKEVSLLTTQVDKLQKEVDKLNDTMIGLKRRQMYFDFEESMMVAVGGGWHPKVTFPERRTAAQAFAAYSNHPKSQYLMDPTARTNFEKFISDTFPSQNVVDSARKVAKIVKDGKDGLVSAAHPPPSIDELTIFATEAAARGDALTHIIANHCAEKIRRQLESEEI
jgi:hypothetical protein